MFKKISLLLGLVAALPASAFAWVGGPFDGGDYNQLLDDRGIYQTAFRFKNGSGFSQFAINADLGPSQNAGNSGGNQNLISDSIGSYLNRAIIYYRGVTYFGNATGMVDHDRRKVLGYSNASSWVTLSSSGSTTDNSGTTSSSATSTIVYNSGLDNTANVEWEGDITSTHPELRYSGDGTLNILSGNALQVVPGSTTTTTLPNGTTITTEIEGYVDIDVDNIDNEKIKIKVIGSRKFFLTRR